MIAYTLQTLQSLQHVYHTNAVPYHDSGTCRRCDGVYLRSLHNSQLRLRIALCRYNGSDGGGRL